MTISKMRTSHASKYGDGDAVGYVLRIVPADKGVHMMNARMNDQSLLEGAERRGFRTKTFRVLLWVLFLALCVGLITPVLQFVIRHRDFSRLHEQVKDKIESLAVRCPTGVPPAQWQNAVDWTSNLISQVYFGPVENDPDSLRELNDGLADRIKGTIDLTTLQWVWEQCEKAPRDGAVYAIRLRSVRLLTKEPITDNDLPHLWSLHECSNLDLGNTDVTDVGLTHLESVTNLAALSLDNTQVTDAGLTHLAGLPNLIALSLNSTQVTDAGLKHLAGLTELTNLSLANTNVTDAGLTYLEGCTKLDILCLNNTKVTEEGVKRLQESLPNCRIGNYAVVVDW
ncbi:MAG: leucine-rich repeat domain-containing protein [Pirellulaceae bacterium]